MSHRSAFCSIRSTVRPGRFAADGAYDGNWIYAAVLRQSADAKVTIPSRLTAVEANDTGPARPEGQSRRRELPLAALFSTACSPVDARSPSGASLPRLTEDIKDQFAAIFSIRAPTLLASTDLSLAAGPGAYRIGDAALET